MLKKVAANLLERDETAAIIVDFFENVCDWPA
jgi:hypothetical protein